MNKKRKIIIAVVCAMLLFIAGFFIVYKTVFDPYRGTNDVYTESLPLDTVLTKLQAEEDIEYVMKMMRSRHPAWLEEQNAKVEAVEAQYEIEIAGLSDSPTVLDVWLSVSRILNRLYDGHTAVFCRYPEDKYIDDFTQLREIGVPKMINGEPTEMVFERFLEIYQYETEEFAYAIFTASVLCNKEYLEWVGIDTSEGVIFGYETDGKTEEYPYSFVPIDEVKGYTGSDDDEWVFYEIDAPHDVGIFTLTTCVCDAQYKKTVKEFFEAVAQQNIDNIVIDLRWNGGGNSLVGDEFLRYIDVDGYDTWPSDVRFGNYLWKNPKSYQKNRRLNPQFGGNVYVLTNCRTYSAAMDFTMLVCDNQIGKVVGEASGNLPDSYGDCLYFVMPNSKLTFSVSYKRWYRVDEAKAGEPLMPDYPCDPEQALEKVYELLDVE